VHLIYVEASTAMNTKFGTTAEYAREDGDDEKVSGDSDNSMARVGVGWVGVSEGCWREWRDGRECGGVKEWR